MKTYKCIFSTFLISCTNESIETNSSTTTDAEIITGSSSSTAASDSDVVCKNNEDCSSDEICVIADIYGRKCKPIINYNYKIIISHFEPFECQSGFAYYKYNTGFVSQLENCPYSWEDEHFIYKIDNDFKLIFYKSDPFGDIKLGTFCFDEKCGAISFSILHDGKYLGFDDKNYGRVFLKIEPVSKNQ